MKAEEKENREFNRHFPKSISQGIKDYVTDTVLKDSRYIFIRRVAGVQFGYCTHCNNRFRTTGDLKHNNSTKCPHCRSNCKIKNHGMSRKYLSDQAFVVYYEKSRINPDTAIIAQAYKVYRNYSGDYMKVETEYVAVARYLFESGNPGRATMYERWGGWQKAQSVHSLWAQSSCSNCRCSMDSIKEAIQGTPFQYSTWDQHPQPQPDYIKFFALYSKYPVVEILTKVGFKYFVGAKLFDQKTYSCINWRAKRFHEVLRLSKQDLNLVLKGMKGLNPMQLRLFQMSRKDSAPPTLQEIKSFFTKSVGDVLNELNVVLKYSSLRKAVNYIRKQIRICETYRTCSALLIAWRDYIRDCETLELDLSHDLILYPKNLYEEHQRTMSLVKTKIDEISRKKMLKRADDLQKYAFEDQRYIIRPPGNADEIIEEGKTLNHCVARYADSHAKGKTTILFIRLKDKPESPYYTMEIRKNEITQTRGFKNSDMTDEVKQFVDQFKKTKLTKRSNRKEVAI
ncbi:PcfJ domain-containing protein [Paenibacillus lautus]|uniref:PcfJ domain-containing protein n=1 Tax=Paenibacillus lautus TaxID=1401 RepID=UPI003D2AD361